VNSKIKDGVQFNKMCVCVCVCVRNASLVKGSEVTKLYT